MKFIQLALAIIFCSFYATAQEKTREITFENVYRNNVFYEAGIIGLQSMSDGEYFTQSTSSMIMKYSYRTGEFTSVLFSMDQLGDPGTIVTWLITGYMISMIILPFI